MRFNNYCFIISNYPEIVDENRPVPTRDQVTALEEHVPSRSTQLSILGLDVQFLYAEHPHFTAGPSTLSVSSIRFALEMCKII